MNKHYINQIICVPVYSHIIDNCLFAICEIDKCDCIQTYGIKSQDEMKQYDSLMHWPFLHQIDHFLPL